MHMRVRVGEEQYAVPVEHAREVLDLGELTPIPGTTANTLGLLNLRGEILPVFDLAEALGIEHEGRARRLLVVEQRERRAGFAVGELLDVGTLGESAHAPDSPYLQAVALIEGELVGVLDVGLLLDALASGATR
jgi:purine-binding chemotaxis protein CheW